MKILFAMAHSGFVRHFEGTIRLLAERGHNIHVSLEKRNILGDNPQLDKLVEEFANISYSKDYNQRDKIWSFLTKNLRLFIDRLQYFHPSYQDAVVLRSRIDKLLPKWYLQSCQLSLFKNSQFRKVLKRFLQFLLKATPKNQQIEDIIAQQEPDLILVTPLVMYGSPQDEYLQIAKIRGIRTGLCVGSWDNLTNKGSIRIMPDIVTVWNEAQKQEAIELHDVCPEKIAVTGSTTYDRWFAKEASTSRQEFCQQVGLAADFPYILYVCSSAFIAPSPIEVQFVEKWIKAIRACQYPNLQKIGILIRPHPLNATQWEEVDFSFDNVTIWPRAGEIPVDEQSESSYYDSMFYSVGVVGINTSAQIESAILNRPVFTILAPEFNHSQAGTIHFRHLSETDEGLLQIAKDFDEHLFQLSQTFENPEKFALKSQKFIQSFVRPYGLDIVANSLLVKTIEELEDRVVPTLEPISFWLYPLQILLYPLAILSLPNKEKRRQAYRETLVQLKQNAPILKDVVKILRGLKKLMIKKESEEYSS